MALGVGAWGGGLWRHWNRDLVMFTLGAGGFLHEIFWQPQERPSVLILCAALMGLPFVLNGRSK